MRVFCTQCQGLDSACCFMQRCMHMKKKTVRRTRSAHTRRRTQPKKNFLFLLKSWMFVVMFALMLGVGAIIGTYINQEMNMSNPQVAGVEIEAGY